MADRVALVKRLSDLCAIDFDAQDRRRRQTAAARISGEDRGADRKDDHLCCKYWAIAGYDFNRNRRTRCVEHIGKIEVYRDHEIDLAWRNENETGVLPQPATRQDAGFRKLHNSLSASSRFKRLRISSATANLLIFIEAVRGKSASHCR